MDNSIRNYLRHDLEEQLDKIALGRIAMFPERDIITELNRRDDLERAKITNPDLRHS